MQVPPSPPPPPESTTGARIAAGHSKQNPPGWRHVMQYREQIHRRAGCLFLPRRGGAAQEWRPLDCPFCQLNGGGNMRKWVFIWKI